MRRAFRRLALALAVLVCRGSVGAAAMQSKGKTSGATQQRVAKNVETSIRSGLGWLIRHQNPDGSWSANSLAAHCTSDPKCDVSKEKYDERLNAGVTALAVLAFLQTGHGPTSDVQIENPVADGATDVGDVVTKALEWLCKRQQLNGQFTPQRAFLYSEALAATALAEGFYRSRDERWKAPAQRAIDFVQSAQRLSPAGSGRWGWRYDSREQVEHDFVGRPAEELKKRVYDADTSVTGWCVRALQSATLAGLDVQPESTAGALAFIRWVSVDNGFVGYIDPKTAGATVTGKNDQFRYHPSVMSALALSVRTSVARDRLARAARVRRPEQRAQERQVLEAMGEGPDRRADPAAERRGGHVPPRRLARARSLVFRRRSDLHDRDQRAHALAGRQVARAARAHASTPSIRQLSPLPMPSSATR